MSKSLLSGNTLLIDQEIQHEAESFVDAAADRVPVQIEFVLEDGERIKLTDQLTRLFTQVISGVANGPLSIQMLPQELTTTFAADMLGVSRPTLMKWVRAGELPARQVGSHTRLSTTDVVEFRKVLDQRREDAFRDLRAWDEAFGDDRLS